MGNGRASADIRRAVIRRILIEIGIALAVGAAALYVVAEWPIEVATFIYREM
jgi:hypothetical protein